MSGDGDRIKVAVARRGTQADRSGAALAASEQGIGSAVDVVSVRYSEADLRSTLDQVANRVAELDVPSGPPVSVGLRPDRNAVVLHLPPGAETAPSSEVAELVDDVTTAFGDMVQIEYDAVSVQPERCVYNTYCDPPLRGGIMMWGARYGCTGAFLARSRSDGKLYQLTAGHCVVGDRTAWTTHFADGSRHAIGPPHSYAFNSRGDMAILRVSNPAGWRARAWVQVTDGPDTGRNESYNIASDASSTVGQRVCITGASSAMSSCGRVTELEMTVNLCLDGACHLMELNRASYCGRPGDSGSPIYASHVAYGIHSASSADCDKFFQDIREAEAVLKVDVSHES